MGTKVTTDYSDLVFSLGILPEHISVLIRGDHGVGKSAIARQMAKKFNLQLFDIRLAQRSEGDIVGLPFREGNSTCFLSPVWFNEACEKPSLIFFDEINRAPTEIMQAAFQIVLDRELNGRKLHPESRVYAAINTNPMYHVNDLDPALLDRFWTADLEPSVNDWLDWAVNSGIHYSILSFIKEQNIMLDSPSDSKKITPGTITQSRRSWEKFSDVLNKNEGDSKFDINKMYKIAIGFIGTEVAASFINFVKNLDVISPEHILNLDKHNTFVRKHLMTKTGEIDNMKLMTASDNLMMYMKKYPGKVLVKNLDNLIKFIEEYGGVSSMNIFMNINSVFSELKTKGVKQELFDGFVSKYTKSKIISNFRNTKQDVNEFMKNKK